MYFNNTLEEGEENNFWKNFHGKAGLDVDLDILSFGNYLKLENGQIKKGHSFGIKVPVGGFLVGGKISDEGMRRTVGIKNANIYTGYENNQLIMGLEGKAGPASGDLSAKYNWMEDKLTLGFTAGLFGQKLDLVKFQIKDAATNTIGRAIDYIRNGVDGIIKHISPEEKAKMKAIEDIRERAGNVRNINDLGAIIKTFGENECLIKGNEGMFEIQKAFFNNMRDMDYRIDQNRLDIDRHEIMLNIHEKRLDAHDIILAEHSKRLDNHENLLRIHGAILYKHERRLNRCETILNIHENRLNEHDRILSFHESILREHEERLNTHALKINELDERMFHAEKNIYMLGKQVDFHSKILSNHDEILKNHGECIEELYDITQNQQIQLKIHNDTIYDHQKEIVNLIYKYHDLKDRIEYDEKVINQLGEEVAKVTNFSIETRSIVDGLSYQTQLHKDLIVQNHNDVVNLYNELQEQADFIISQGNILKEIVNELNFQKEILHQHELKIIELQKFVKDIMKDIKNIYEILGNFDERLSKVEKEIESIKIQMSLKEIYERIQKRVKKLVKKVDKFNDDEKADFIKCSYIAIAAGKYNLDQLEKIVNNIKPEI